MPRVNIGRSKFEDLQRILEGQKKVINIHHEEMARACGLSKSTLQKRLKDPGEFTLKEISALLRKMGVPIEEGRQTAIRY